MIISLTKIWESSDDDEKIQAHLHGANNKEERGEQQGCEENHPWPDAAEYWQHIGEAKHWPYITAADQNKGKEYCYHIVMKNWMEFKS